MLRRIERIVPPQDGIFITENGSSVRPTPLGEPVLATLTTAITCLDNIALFHGIDQLGEIGKLARYYTSRNYDRTNSPFKMYVFQFYS